MQGARVFKFLCNTAFLVLLAMLYWSSLLHEQDLKKMRQDLKDLRLEMAGLSQKLIRELHTVHSESNTVQKEVRVESATDYPNLLEADPYLTTTLPQQLAGISQTFSEKTGLGDIFRPQGILKRALLGKPENLHPFNGYRDVSVMMDMCSTSVAGLQTGRYETLAPKMGVRLEARPRPNDPSVQEYWVFLRDDVYWEPLKPDHFPDTFELASHFLKRHPVTAHDYKFFYDAVMNPYIHETKAASLRTYVSDIEDFIVVDDYTFIVRWKTFPTKDDAGNEIHKVKYTSLTWTGALQPLPRFVFQYFADGQKIIDDDSESATYRKNSVWAQNFSNHWAKNVIVSCGPYIFDGMNEEGISFKRNPNFFDPYAALVEGIKYGFKESPDAIWQDFKTGKIDLCTLSPNQMMEFETFLKSPDYQVQKESGKAINTIDYVDLSYFYIGWNQLKPFFDDERVRKALTFAIDCRRIIEQNLNRMGVSITGPFFRYSSSYDESVEAFYYNPERAKQLLDETGWVDFDGDGIREKVINGEKILFRFKLYYFSKSLSTKVIAEYIATTLRDIGIHCELCGLDIADLSRQFEDKSFDAIFMGWKLGTPPDDPRQLWHSSGAKEKGSSNAIGFVNNEIDHIIELLNYEDDKETRLSLYHQFHRIIHQESPYTFLYTPKVRLLVRECVRNVFIPRERQDLILHADISEPHLQSVWIVQ